MGWVWEDPYGMSSLRLNGLHKSFGQIQALRGLDLTVEEGQFYAILGPSAGGKTTTLRMVAGLERPDSGTVEIAGVDVTQAPINARDVAMVFQTFALYPHMSVRNNLAYPLKERRVASSEVTKRVDETAQMLRLTHLLDRKPATASGGEQQRIAIGRALIHRPALLLLDEPLTNLDAKLRNDMRAEIKKLHRDFGMTIVYATPDELEALSMGQVIAVLRDGQVAQTGTPDELYERPDNLYVATKVGSPPMNIFDGTSNGTGAVAVGFGEIASEKWSSAAAQTGANMPIKIGIRPSDILLAESGQDGIDAEIALTEPLGDVTLLDLEAGGESLKMILPEATASKMNRGDALRVTFDSSKTYLFRSSDGLAVR